MHYLANAFSLQMCPADCVLSVRPMQPEDVPEDCKSIIGHADTANVVSGILGRSVALNRESITLVKDDEVYVAQVMGGRLPEGCTTLPDGIEIKFLRVVVATHCDGCNAVDCQTCGGITPLFY